MAKDYNKVDLSVGDEVICKERSILIVPMCTNEEERPFRNSNIYIEKYNEDSSDEKRIRRYNSTISNSIIHRDVILEKKDLKKGEKVITYRISDINSDYLLLEPSDKNLILKFYHPSCKFIRIKKIKHEI